MNDEINQTILIKITNHLAKNLGISVDDITEEDLFFEDLHMQPSDFADFLEELTDTGMETDSIDLPSIKSVGDLVEALSSHEYIS